MKKITLAYFGTPSFSANFLEKILTDKTLPIEVKLVVTQPDRPVGKKQILTPSPVKEIAKKYKIEITTGVEVEGIPTARMRGLSGKRAPAGGKPRQAPLLYIDLALVCAFGKIIPKKLLTQPKYGFWNIHYSLLPKYRGPSPVAYSLAFGEAKTGVTIFQMDEKIDHGPIIAQQELEILPNERRPDLEKRLTDLAFEMFKKLIKTGVEVEGIPTARMRGLSGKQAPAGGKPRQAPFLTKLQNHRLATYTRLLKKEDGFIPLFTLKKALKNEPLTFEELPKIMKEYLSKYQISNIKYQNDILKIKNKTFNSSLLTFNLFRGLYPWPGIWTILPNSKRLKIIDMNFVEEKTILKKVQLEGKKEVDFETFNRAYKIF